MKKIIVIEDNTDVRENLTEILQLAGYKTISAANGKEGLIKINETKPDLILCDVMMPELDGFGVLKILSGTPHLATIPFIFLTAKAEKFDFRKGMSLGASDYITKPFDDTDLLQSIETRLKIHEYIPSHEKSQLKTLESINSNYFNDKLKVMSESCESKKYKKREVVFEEGTIVRNIFFVEKGSVRIFRTNEFGKELTTRIVKKDESMGFIDGLNLRPYSKSAQCLEETILKLIPVKTYLEVFSEDKDFSLSLLKHLAVYSNILEVGLLHQAYSSVRKKVANALITCFEKGDANPVITMQRDELASLAGTAKETLIRTLSDFKTEGLIEIEDAEIHIKSINGLINMHQ